MKLKFCGFLHSGERWWFDSAVARVSWSFWEFIWDSQHGTDCRWGASAFSLPGTSANSFLFFIVVDKFNGDDGSSAHRSAGQEPGPSQVESELTYPPAEWLNLCVARSSELIHSSAQRRSSASNLYFFSFFSSPHSSCHFEFLRLGPVRVGWDFVFLWKWNFQLRYFIYTLCARSARRICSNIKTSLALFFSWQIWAKCNLQSFVGAHVVVVCPMEHSFSFPFDASASRRTMATSQHMWKIR